MPQEKRKGVSQSVRFEVFKRDKFKCQYCGRVAPDVILEIDHIKPVAEGGTNKIINLLTSCFDCNRGKSDKLLSDDSAITRQRNQLEQLQERREQLDMLMQWHEGLADIKSDEVDKLNSYWISITSDNWTCTETGKAKIRKWLNKFSINEIVAAMDTAAANYLQYYNNEVTSESWDTAFNKIYGILTLTRADKDDPDLKELFYLRGILRNRVTVRNNWRALSELKRARNCGVELSDLKHLVLSVNNWYDFIDSIENIIKEMA